jgi:hypothetical protein
VVFKLCAAALWGAVRNLKGAAKFFRQDETLQFFYQNLLGCATRNIWYLSGCREPKSLKTTALGAGIFLIDFLKFSKRFSTQKSSQKLILIFYWNKEVCKFLIYCKNRFFY